MRLAVATVSLSVLLGCKAAAPVDAGPAAAEERARAVLAPFKASLKEALLGALKDGPEKAVEVCASAAPSLARSAAKDGVTVGRTSSKLRNPDNAPKAWLGPVLAEFEKAPSGSETKKTVPLGGGRYGYAEAIWIQAPCLACHGAAVAPSVKAALSRYPKDAATGYALGELRGVFYAEIEPR